MEIFQYLELLIKILLDYMKFIKKNYYLKIINFIKIIQIYHKINQK